MRFLFAAKHPPVGGVAFGGVASWIQTISEKLNERGHKTAIFDGKTAAEYGRFDVGVLSNFKSVKRAAEICDRVLCVSHGIVGDEEPVDGSAIFTSEEIRDHWRGVGPVVRQPIDLQFWRCGEKHRRDFVLYSYRAHDDFGLSDLASQLGLNFVWIKDVTREEARDSLQSAALVAASGRAALEAMACHAPTMICDYRPYNGSPLICQDMNKARRFNYSGRGGIDPALVDMRRFAIETMSFQNPRGYVEKWHDAEKITEELIALC